jgi:hypothetical protein
VLSILNIEWITKAFQPKNTIGPCNCKMEYLKKKYVCVVYAAQC